MGRVIDATLRLVDSFTPSAGQTIKTMSGMSKEAERMRKSVEKAGKTITSEGSKLTKSITLPVVGVATAAVKTAADFESSMSQVAATMGTAKNEIGDLTELAKQMGRATSFSASEAADGINILAMAGLNATEINASLGTVLDLAAAGATDMGSSASYVVGAVKGFGDGMDNATKYADIMAKGATLANTDVASLGEALSYGAATAAGYSQSVDSTTLALLRMAEQNVTGQTAATGLNRAMADLYSPSDAAKKALDSIGISAYNADGSARDFNIVVDELSGSLGGMTESQANALKSTIFSMNGMNAFNKMTASTSERVEELQKGLESAGGSAAQQAATQLDNLQGQITMLKSATEGIAITIGEKLMPYIKQAVEWFQKAADYVNNLSDAQVENIMKWVGIAAAVGPAIMVFGKLVTGSAKVFSIFSKVSKAGGVLKFAIAAIGSPAGIVIGILLAIVAAGILVYKNFDKVKAAGAALAQRFAPQIESIKRAFDNVVQAVGALGPKFSVIKEKFMNMVDAIINSPVVQFLKDVFVLRIEATVSAVTGFFEGFSLSIGQILDGVMNALEGLITFITGVFSGDWEMAWEGVKQLFGGIFEAIVGIAKGVINGVASAVNAVIDTINRAGFTIPDWIPGIGGKAFSIDIPTIPMLARGTDNWVGGVAQVHEKGGEIIDLPRGSRVYPHDESIRMARSEGKGFYLDKIADTVIVREDADIDKIVDALVRKLRKASPNVGGAY